jgi:hypothetical protein
MNIPRFLQLVKEGRMEDAFESILFVQSPARLNRPRLSASVRVALPPEDAG